jgi:hypothetical protein
MTSLSEKVGYCAFLTPDRVGSRPETSRCQGELGTSLISSKHPPGCADSHEWINAASIRRQLRVDGRLAGWLAGAPPARSRVPPPLTMAAANLLTTVDVLLDTRDNSWLSINGES